MFYFCYVVAVKGPDYNQWEKSHKSSPIVAKDPYYVMLWKQIPIIDCSLNYLS